MRTTIVVGGGVAGISCLEALVHNFNDEQPAYDRLLLISESSLVKKISDYELRGRQLEVFKVLPATIAEIIPCLPSKLHFEHITGRVNQILHNQKKLIIIINSVKTAISYDQLCLCHGASPRQLVIDDNPQKALIENRMIVIRDTTTLFELERRLASCKRIAIVGNGGIGIETVFKIKGCEKYWIIKDDHIGANYFDSGASKFLLDNSNYYSPTSTDKSDIGPPNIEASGRSQFGPALGPGWSLGLRLLGGSDGDNLHIVYNDGVAKISYDDRKDSPITVKTEKGKSIYCDLIIVAIGVEPNSAKILCESLELDENNGGILVDNQMRTSIEGIYAAGDVISCAKWPSNKLWFQMRLWNQARQMGYYSGRCISCHLSREDPTLYFGFDCFTHCTTFFGYQLVLIGRFNAQREIDSHDNDERLEIFVRVNPNKDYVKIVLSEGKVIGAVMIGDSGLEETVENLIHDQINVDHIKEHLLDDTVDIEDYFD